MSSQSLSITEGHTESNTRGRCILGIQGPSAPYQCQQDLWIKLPGSLKKGKKRNKIKQKNLDSEPSLRGKSKSACVVKRISTSKQAQADHTSSSLQFSFLTKEPRREKAKGPPGGKVHSTVKLFLQRFNWAALQILTCWRPNYLSRSQSSTSNEVRWETINWK